MLVAVAAGDRNARMEDLVTVLAQAHQAFDALDARFITARWRMIDPDLVTLLVASACAT